MSDGSQTKSTPLGDFLKEELKDPEARRLFEEGKKAIKAGNLVFDFASIGCINISVEGKGGLFDG